MLVGKGGREYAEKMAFEWGHPQRKKVGWNVKYFNKTLKWDNVLINEVLVFKRKTKERQKITQIRTVMCGGDVTKLKKLRLPEVNKYLNHHGLRQHLKSSKSDKVNTIERRSCLQQKSPLTAEQPTLRNVRR